MANIQDYLIWRGDVPLSAVPLNEVDGLVLSELVYADFSGLVPQDGSRVPFRQVYDGFWRRHTKEEILSTPSFTKMAPFLMDPMVNAARFGDMKLSLYRDVVDTQADCQWAAVTFHLSDGTDFVAYRGTDTTIVGWKEDFNLSYQAETEGQRLAADYLNRHFSTPGAPLYVGGHSKGGNLAVYAAVCAGEAARGRIAAVYNYDGPGFLESFTQKEAYRAMLPRILSIVPEGSVIGALLSSEGERRVVKSGAFGIMQHDGFTWQVLGPRFQETEKRSDVSLTFETVMHKWLSQLDEEDRRLFVSSLFGLFEATGKSTFDQMLKEKGKSLASMRKMLESMPREQRENVWNMLMQLLKAGRETLYEDAKRGIRTRLEGAGAAHESERKQEKLT